DALRRQDGHPPLRCGERPRLPPVGGRRAARSRGRVHPGVDGHRSGGPQALHGHLGAVRSAVRGPGPHADAPVRERQGQQRAGRSRPAGRRGGEVRLASQREQRPDPHAGARCGGSDPHAELGAPRPVHPGPRHPGGHD
ncbi:MAG: hypothetical protein ACK55Z_13100, partial [bacterium]